MPQPTAKHALTQHLWCFPSFRIVVLKASLTQRRKETQPNGCIFLIPSGFLFDGSSEEDENEYEKAHGLHGYYEASYGLLNDAGLTMDESTCS